MSLRGSKCLPPFLEESHAGAREWQIFGPDSISMFSLLDFRQVHHGELHFVTSIDTCLYGETLTRTLKCISTSSVCEDLDAMCDTTIFQHNHKGSAARPRGLPISSQMWSCSPSSVTWELHLPGAFNALISLFRCFFAVTTRFARAWPMLPSYSVSRFAVTRLALARRLPESLCRLVLSLPSPLGSLWTERWARQSRRSSRTDFCEVNGAALPLVAEEMSLARSSCSSQPLRTHLAPVVDANFESALKSLQQPTRSYGLSATSAWLSGPTGPSSWERSPFA